MTLAGIAITGALLLTLGLPAPTAAAPEDVTGAAGKGSLEPAPAADALPEDGDAALRTARRVLAPVRDKSMRLTMRLVDDSGRERVKKLSGYEKHGDTARKVLWLFESPMELQGTGFLAWQNEKKADSLWVYFPGQRRVRRVPASLRQEKFQGSLFTYEDLIAVFFLDYEGKHTLKGEEACGDSRCLLVETELEPGIFAYERLKVWLNKDTFLPARVEFHGEELMKVMTVTRTENIDGIPSIVEVEMRPPAGGTTTYVEMEKILYNQDLRNNIFTIEHLSQSGK